jgi:hypothetical protein
MRVICSAAAGCIIVRCRGRLRRRFWCSVWTSCHRPCVANTALAWYARLCVLLEVSQGFVIRSVEDLPSQLWLCLRPLQRISASLSPSQAHTGRKATHSLSACRMQKHVASWAFPFRPDGSCGTAGDESATDTRNMRWHAISPRPCSEREARSRSWQVSC